MMDYVQNPFKINGLYICLRECIKENVGMKAIRIGISVKIVNKIMILHMRNSEII